MVKVETAVVIVSISSCAARKLLAGSSDSKSAVAIVHVSVMISD